MNRVSSLAALYGKGYRWNGSCRKCGEFDHDEYLWAGSWCAVCCICGAWICHHTMRGQAIHTSDDLWYGSKCEPAGCPILTEGPTNLRSVAQERHGSLVVGGTPERPKRGTQGNRLGKKRAQPGEPAPSDSRPPRAAPSDLGGGSVSLNAGTRVPEGARLWPARRPTDEHRTQSGPSAGASEGVGAGSAITPAPNPGGV